MNMTFNLTRDLFASARSNPLIIILIKSLILNLINLSCVGVKNLDNTKYSYYENLAMHRPNLLDVDNQSEIQDKGAAEFYTENIQVDEFINGIYSKARKNNVALYTIQAYIGPQRDEAMKYKQLLYSLKLPYIIRVIFKDNNYIVTIGAFTDIYFARNLYYKVRKRLTRAIIKIMNFDNDPDFVKKIVALEGSEEINIK
jgi:hypothetical protein